MAVQTLDMVTPKPIDNKPKRDRAAEKAKRAEKPAVKADPMQKFGRDRRPTHDEVREDQPAGLQREEPVMKRAGVADLDPPKLDVKAGKHDFYAALERGDATAGFLSSHGTWQKWVSTIKTEAGVRGVHETKMVPCTCDLCQNAIEEKGWTF